MLELAKVQCPYCWQTLELQIDCSEPSQQYTEDCHVCCRPMVVGVEVDQEGVPEVWVNTEDDA